MSPQQTYPRPALTVARATADDWADVRAVRLAALTDSPEAFGSTRAREQEFDEERWRAWTTSAALFIARADGRLCGMAAGVEGAGFEDRKVVAVWVDPSSRGRGAASLLLAAVENWARRHGVRRLTLWVTRDNPGARRLYEGRGYVRTGEVKTMPAAPGRWADEMVLPLSG